MEKTMDEKDKEIAKLRSIIRDMVHQVLLSELKMLDMERAATVNPKKES